MCPSREGYIILDGIYVQEVSFKMKLLFLEMSSSLCYSNSLLISLCQYFRSPSYGGFLTLCCADSTPGLKSVTVNKRKLNNKHTQRTQEFTQFGKLPTFTETTEKPKSQYTLTFSHPQDKKTLFFFLCGCCSLG